MRDKSKIRKYNVVFHNVDNEKAQATLLKYVDAKAKEYLLSVEPNPRGDGYHAHLTIEYKVQRYFKPVLKELQKMIVPAITPRPEGETRCWGRIQLEPTRGTLQDNLAYLQGETKDKPLGEILQGKKVLLPPEDIQRMLACTYQMYVNGKFDAYPGVCWDFDEKYLEDFNGRFSEWCFEKYQDDYELLTKNKNLRP